MALDPLSAVEQATQGAQRTLHPDAASVFDSMDCTHLVGHGTDTADTRRNIRRLGIGPAPQERLEEARRLEDLKVHLLHAARFETNRERPFTLDAGQVVHLDRLTLHGPRS